DWSSDVCSSDLPPPPPMNFWTLYLEGVGPDVAAIDEVNAHNLAYQWHRQLQPLYCANGVPAHPLVADALPGRSFMLFCASAVGVQGMAGAPMLATQANLFNTVDRGRPALPILMVRAGRLAVA